MATLTIVRVKCNTKEDYIGKDDIYLRVNGKRYKVGRFSNNTSEEVGKSWAFDDEIEVQIWEQDEDPDDKIGEHTFHASEAGGGVKKQNYSGHGASYDLWYKIE
jgi:hypothetical protein